MCVRIFEKSPRKKIDQKNKNLYKGTEDQRKRDLIIIFLSGIQNFCVKIFIVFQSRTIKNIVFTLLLRFIQIKWVL